MPIQSDGFGTIFQILNGGGSSGGGLAGTTALDGALGAGAVGKTLRIVPNGVNLDDPTSVIEDGNGDLWVGNGDNDTCSLVKLDGETFVATEIQLGPSNPFGDDPDDTVEVSRITHSSPYVFVSTVRGAIYVLNTSTNAVVGTLVGGGGGSSSEPFFSICIDDNGDVWAMSGSSPSTIYKWTAPFTVTAKAPAATFGLGYNMTGLIFASGYLWSGSGGGNSLLHRNDRTNGNTVSHDTTLSYAWIPHAAGGLIWIAGPEEVHGYDPDTFPGPPASSQNFPAPVAAREVLHDGSGVWVFCDDTERSILIVYPGSGVDAILTYPLMDDPMSPILVGGNKIWFCNNDDDASGEGALVRIDINMRTFDARYQGPTKVGYVDDTGRGNWMFARGGVQEAPFLNPGGRVIWQQDENYGPSIQNDGADRFRLYGGYDIDHHFRLEGSIGVTDGQVSYQWYNVTDDAPVGRLATTARGIDFEARAYLTVRAGQSKVVELRFMYMNNVSFIGSQGEPEGDVFPSAFIEMIGAGGMAPYDD